MKLLLLGALSVLTASSFLTASGFAVPRCGKKKTNIMTRPCADDNDNDQPSANNEPASASNNAYQSLLQEHLLDALYHQALFSKRVARGRDWNLSLDPNDDNNYGRLGFGRQDYYACQILGSESYVSGTWLWSNANDSIPSDMQRCTQELRARFHDIFEFQHDQVSLNLVQGHELARIACGVLGHPCYYSGPNGTVGRVLYVLTDPTLHDILGMNNNNNDNQDPDVDELVLSVGRAANLDLFTITLDWVERFLKKHGASDALVQPTRDGGQERVYRFSSASASDNTVPPTAIVSLDHEGDVTGIRTPEEETGNKQNSRTTS